MQFPESWLREFCNPPLSTDELADLLTMSGLEVEEMRAVALADSLAKACSRINGIATGSGYRRQKTVAGR